MSKSQPPACVHPNPDGTVSVQYMPKESGIHDINVSYNDIPVHGKSQLATDIRHPYLNPMKKIR